MVRLVSERDYCQCENVKEQTGYRYEFPCGGHQRLQARHRRWNAVSAHSFVGELSAVIVSDSMCCMLMRRVWALSQMGHMCRYKLLKLTASALSPCRYHMLRVLAKVARRSRSDVAASSDSEAGDGSEDSKADVVSYLPADVCYSIRPIANWA